MRHTVAAAGLGLLLGGALAAPAVAQTSRIDAIAVKQAEKAKALKPPQPDKAERLVKAAEEILIESPSGFYPYFDSVYSGGGFTLGAGYRQFFRPATFWDVKGLYSFSGYKLIHGSVVSRELGRRTVVDAHAGWRDATQVGYFGLGMDTSPDDRTNFRFNQGYLGGGLRARPHPWVAVSAGVDYEDYTLKEGQGTYPSIEEVYTPETAPGLGLNPAYFHWQGSAGVDSRTSPGYTRKGGYYGAALHGYADLDGDQSFERLDVDVIQHVPIMRETWVVSVRGRVQTTLQDEDQVPFFLMPSLGSGSTLRAYTSWRFRDRHSILASGEFRWIPSRTALDMAIFYDTGKVTSRRKYLDFQDLTSNWGVGVRFHGPAATPLRIEMAHGTEGWNLVFSGSAAF